VKRGGPRLMRPGEMGLSLCTAIDADDYNEISLIPSLQHQHLYLIPFKIYRENAVYQNDATVYRKRFEIDLKVVVKSKFP